MFVLQSYLFYLLRFFLWVNRRDISQNMCCIMPSLDSIIESCHKSINLYSMEIKRIVQ